MNMNSFDFNQAIRACNQTNVLQKHIKSDHDKTTFKCDICTSNFDAFSMTKVIFKQIYVFPKIPYQCEICKNTFFYQQ